MRGGRPAVIEGSSKTGRAAHKAWRAAVAEVARDVADDEPHDGRCRRLSSFRLRMPGQPTRQDRTQPGSRPKSTKPDIDKLIRATLDGLTDGGLIADDAARLRCSRS